MSELAQAFIDHLAKLNERSRGPFAHLRRSLGFEPGAYPRAYPYVERFVGADKHAEDPWRKALYLTAGLYAFHPMHRPTVSLASAFGHFARERGSDSLEHRFIALLGAESESLPNMLRQLVSLLASAKLGCDYVQLLDDLVTWYEALQWRDERRKSQVCQRWARDFYRALEPYNAPAEASESASDTASTL